MLLITLAFGAALHPLTGYSLTLLLLAFIPGGLTEMSLIALALGVDPAFVVTHHGVRVSLVVLIALPAFAWLTDGAARHRPAGQPGRDSAAPAPAVDKDRRPPSSPALTRPD